jgi:hypothetical protein
LAAFYEIIIFGYLERTYLLPYGCFPPFSQEPQGKREKRGFWEKINKKGLKIVVKGADILNAVRGRSLFRNLP